MQEGIFFPPKRALVEGEGGRRLSKKQLKRVQQVGEAGQVSAVPQSTCAGAGDEDC